MTDTIHATCIFCKIYGPVLKNWWNLGIDICPGCNENRRVLSLERVKESMKLEKIPG